MSRKRLWQVLGVAVIGFTLLGAGTVERVSTRDVATAVSPGAASKLALVEGRCPTFSWGTVPGARGYELVVYRLEGDGAVGKPVLRESFAGSVSSWTPSLDRCLEPGAQYAWSARATGAGGGSAWSAPGLFEVAPAPGATAMIDEALRVVREYLARSGEVEAASAAGSSSLPPATGRASTSAVTVAPLAPAPTLLSVDGNVDATTYTGDGSNLTGIRPDPPCYDETQRFVDCGNGTVTDTATGLIYLKDADCFAPATFSGANAQAAQLKHGSCALTDNSGVGDWRLQTRQEWEEIRRPFCPTPPKIVGNGPNSFSCYSDSPWATGVLSAFYWSSSTLINVTTYAWMLNLTDGTQISNRMKTELHYAWPVRGTGSEPGPAGPTGPTG